MRRQTVRAILPVLLLTIASTVMADSVTSQMAVSAHVVARAQLTISQQPAAVQITREDIVRGYVDLAEPIVVQVRSNSLNGYLLQVANEDATFSKVELTFGNTSMTVAGESWVRRPYTREGESIAMHARLQLSPETQPGQYPLPIAITASAI